MNIKPDSRPNGGKKSSQITEKGGSLKKSSPISEKGGSPKKSSPISEKGGNPKKSSPISEKGGNPKKSSPISEKGGSPKKSSPISEKGGNPKKSSPISETGGSPKKSSPISETGDNQRNSPNFEEKEKHQLGSKAGSDKSNRENSPISEVQNTKKPHGDSQRKTPPNVPAKRKHEVKYEGDITKKKSPIHKEIVNNENQNMVPTIVSEAEGNEAKPLFRSEIQIPTNESGNDNDQGLKSRDDAECSGASSQKAVMVFGGAVDANFTKGHESGKQSADDGTPVDKMLENENIGTTDEHHRPMEVDNSTASQVKFCFITLKLVTTF